MNQHGILLILFVGSIHLDPAFAATEGMTSMPLAKESRVFNVTGTENFKATQGFGRDEPKIKMMNLMMVGGSGYEGMDMSALDTPKSVPDLQIERVTHTQPSLFEMSSSITPDPPEVGTNQLDVLLIHSKTRKPVTGQKLKAEVAMSSMDMGTDEPTVKEVEPGHYRMQVSFSMQGPWTVTLKDQNQWQSVLKFSVMP
jgi:hypothetical protein